MARATADAPPPAGDYRTGRHARHRWSTVERDLRRSGVALIAGVDEVGRGSLAGPVVACAVIMPADTRAIAGVNDSKRLTARARERLACVIRRRAVELRVAAASAREIDRFNIYHASALAMRRALYALRVTPDHVLVDGRRVRTLGMAHTPVVHGDARCFNIACASILAKVTRDRLMRQLALRYPEYCWNRNCGYATSQHVTALASRGPSPHHRRSFLVKALLDELLAAADAGDPDTLGYTLGDTLAEAAVDAERRV